MPCLLTLIALSTPRLVVALLWLFSNWFSFLMSSNLFNAFTCKSCTKSGWAVSVTSDVILSFIIQ